MGQRVFETAPSDESGREVVVRLGVAGSQPDCFEEFVDRLAALIYFSINAAEIVVGIGEFGFFPDAGFEMNNCILISTIFTIGDAEIPVAQPSMAAVFINDTLP